MCAQSGTSTGSDGHDPVCEALARSLMYRFLARALRHPEPGTVAELIDACSSLQAALEDAAPEVPTSLVSEVADEIDAISDDEFAAEHVRLFGHVVRGALPCYETEYGSGDDGLLQAHELADLGAFYEVAGLRLRHGERGDHAVLECEFLQYLTRKEAHGHEQDDERMVQALRDLERGFLESHLGRWAPAWLRRVGEESGPLAAVGRLGDAFLTAECRRFQLAALDEPLVLRVPLMGPDEAMSCGVGPAPAPSPAMEV